MFIPNAIGVRNGGSVTQSTINKYCLPYWGDNILMDSVLSTTTDFIGHLDHARMTTEKKFAAAMAILIASMYSLSKTFERRGKCEAADFSEAIDEFANMAMDLNLNFEDIYFHEGEKNYIIARLEAFGPRSIAESRRAARAISLIDYRKTIFCNGLMDRSVDATTSLQFGDYTRNFVLESIKNDSDDVLLMRQLGECMNTHFLWIGAIPSTLEELHGKPALITV